MPPAQGASKKKARRSGARGAKAAASAGRSGKRAPAAKPRRSSAKNAAADGDDDRGVDADMRDADDDANGAAATTGVD